MEGVRDGISLGGMFAMDVEVRGTENTESGG